MAFTIGGFDRPHGIATANADGSDFQHVLAAVDMNGQPHGGTEGPRWTPTGRLLFSSNRAGGPDDWHVFEMGADGSEPIQLTSGDDGIEFYPATSPDGSILVYGKALATPQGPAPFGGGGIFASDADGSHERQVTQVPSATSPDYPEGAVDEWPDFAPDGTRVAFARALAREAGLFVVSLDGTHLQRVVEADMQATRPRWSPDGEWLLFHSNSERFQTESSNLWLVHADGTDLHQLTHESVPGQAWAADWSPDGQHIVFVHTNESSGTSLDVVGVDGSPTCTFYRGSGSATGWDPDWGPA